MHRSREIIMKWIIDQGKSEVIAGLNVVCMGRFKRLVDPPAKSMPLGRILGQNRKAG